MNARPVDLPVVDLSGLKPQDLEEQKWYAVGFQRGNLSGSATPPGNMPLAYQAWYDLGVADRRSNQPARAAWSDALEDQLTAQKEGRAAEPAPAPLPPAPRDASSLVPAAVGGAALLLGLLLFAAASSRNKSAARSDRYG